MYIFLGIVVVLLLTTFLLSDLDRKRERIGGLVVRLEPLAKDQEAKNRVRHLRRLGHSSSLFYEQLLRGMDAELAVLESNNGLSPPERSSGFSLFSAKRMNSLEERIAQLESALG